MFEYEADHRCGICDPPSIETETKNRSLDNFSGKVFDCEIGEVQRKIPTESILSRIEE